MIRWKQLVSVSAATSWMLLGGMLQPHVNGQEEATTVGADHTLPAPSIIIRPPSHQANPLSDCVVEINPIGDPVNSNYAVRISIPDSVSVVEVEPDRSAGARRNFRIRMDQPMGPSVPQHRDMLIDEQAPVQAGVSNPQSLDSTTQTSSRILFRNAAGPNKPTTYPQRQVLPTVTVPIERAEQQDYQPNPFFETTSTIKGIKANLSDHSLIDFPDEMPGRPVLASFRPPAKDTFTDNSKVVQPIPTVEPNAEETKSIASGLQIEHFGPTALGLGAIGDYVIEVTNSTSDEIFDITIDLDVPEGLEIVLLGDQAAIDNDQKRVTWRLPNIHANAKSTVRYRVKSISEGIQNQTTRIRSSNADEPQLASEFATRVRVDYETLGASKLDFESK